MDVLFDDFDIIKWTQQNILILNLDHKWLKQGNKLHTCLDMQ